MKVWLVEALDRYYYDDGGTRVVGIYSTEEKAKIAADLDKEIWLSHPYHAADSDIYDYAINEVEVE